MQLAMNNDYDHVLFSVIGVIDFFGLDGNTKIYVLPTYRSLHYFFQLQNYRQSVLYVRVSQSVIIYQSCVILSLQPQSSQEMVIQSSLLLKTRKGGREGNFDGWNEKSAILPVCIINYTVPYLHGLFSTF